MHRFKLIIGKHIPIIPFIRAVPNKKNVSVCVLLSLLAHSSIVKGIDDINTISLLEQKTQHYQFNFNPKGLCVKDELFTQLKKYIAQFNSSYFVFLFINCSKQNKVRVCKVRGDVRFEMSQIAP